MGFTDPADIVRCDFAVLVMAVTNVANELLGFSVVGCLSSSVSMR